MKTKNVTTKKQEVITTLLDCVKSVDQPNTERILSQYPLKYLRLMEKVFNISRLNYTLNNTCVYEVSSEDVSMFIPELEMVLDKNDMESCKVGDLSINIESPELKKLCYLLKTPEKYQEFKNEVNDLIKSHKDLVLETPMSSSECEEILYTTQSVHLHNDFDNGVTITWDVRGEYILIGFFKGDYEVCFVCPLDVSINL